MCAYSRVQLNKTKLHVINQKYVKYIKINNILCYCLSKLIHVCTCLIPKMTLQLIVIFSTQKWYDVETNSSAVFAYKIIIQ